MKTMKFFLTATLMVCSLVLSAQTTVTKAVERYLVANGQSESMGASLKPLLAQIPSMIELTIPNGYTAGSLAQKYVDERLVGDLSSAISPFVIEQDVTAEDINVLSDMLESPEGKVATANSQRLNSEECLADMMAIVQKDMMTLVAGGTPDKTPTKASAARKALFMAYYNSCGIDKLIPNMLKAQLAGQASNEMMAKVESYFNENMPNLMLNASEGVMTDNDLRFYQKLCAKPQYTKMIDGIAKAIGNPQQLGLSIITKYNIWVKGL